ALLRLPRRHTPSRRGRATSGTSYLPAGSQWTMGSSVVDGSGPECPYGRPQKGHRERRTEPHASCIKLREVGLGYGLVRSVFDLVPLVADGVPVIHLQCRRTVGAR